MQQRLRWTDDEVGRVGDDAIMKLAQRYQQQGDLFGSVDSIGKRQIEDALFESQMILPSSRRKRAFGSLIYDRLETHVRAGLRKEAARRKQKQGQSTNTVPTPPVEEPTTLTVDPEFSLAEVICLMGGAIAQGMKLAFDAEPNGAAEILREIFGTPAPTPAANDALVRKPPMRAQHRPEAPRSHRRPKVAVIGLLDSQRRAIERDMPHLDLRFWGKGDMTQRVGAITAHADKVIVMTKFVSHTVVRQIRGKYLSVNGGMTALARALNDQYAVAAVA